MADLGAQLNQLSPQQKQAVLMQAQQEANQKVMEEMMNKMVAACYDKCAGTSGDRLDSREQSCMGYCQDRHLETRAQVQETLLKRQGDMH
mmetsp:Transcript_22392/g.32108  ORF Transcript_22392/g.32108 Transcript_22392/m.32108 type:complete len:90 (+) Transcript_22392:1707-1976(+)